MAMRLPARNLASIAIALCVLWGVALALLVARVPPSSSAVAAATAAVTPLRPFPAPTRNLRAGFTLDRLVAFGRNRGVPASHRLPGGRVVSRGHAVQRFPGLRRQGLTGAAVFFDYLMTEPDRLLFSFATAAAGNGAVLANHVQAMSPLWLRPISAMT